MQTTVYTKNLKVGRSEEHLRRIADHIIWSGAGHVCLQEVNGDNQRILEMLKDHYPTQASAAVKHIGRVAVLSAWPLAKGNGTTVSSSASASVAVRVQNPSGDMLWIYSVHLEAQWQNRARHDEQVGALAAQIALLNAPTIVAGDFNAGPTSSTHRGLTRFAKLRRIGKARKTWGWRCFGKSLDHVYATNTATGWNRRQPKLRSDHYGLFARVRF